MKDIFKAFLVKVNLFDIYIALYVVTFEQVTI